MKIFDCDPLLTPLDIRAGEMIYVSSELLLPMWRAKKRGEVFEPDALIDALQRRVTSEGTLLIPAYNFDFSNKGSYDIRHSKSSVGHLANVAMERSDFVRTRHPIHSLMVWGREAGTLQEMDNLNSFGKDTPFALMIERGAREIGIGLGSYGKATTFVHEVEVEARVPYRFTKRFTGSYTDENGKTMERTFLYAARDYSLTYTKHEEGLARILEENGASFRTEADGVPLYSVDMKKAYPALYRLFTTDRCEGYLDFSIDRDYLFGGGYEVCRD